MVKEKKHKSSKEKESTYSSQLSKLSSTIGKLKEKEKGIETKREKQIESYDYGKGKHQEYREEKKGIEKQIRVKQAQKGIVQVERFNPVRIGQNLLKKPLLKKPRAKIPSYSGTKFVKQLASSVQVNEVPNYEPREIINDNRSLFFNEEFKNERKEGMKWLGN